MSVREFYHLKVLIALEQVNTTEWPKKIRIFISKTVGMSLRAGGRGFSLATKRVASGYFYWKVEGKIAPKEIPSGLIPLLLVVFTRQLEILVTTLKTVMPGWVL